MRNYYPGITVYKLAGAVIVLLAHAMLLKYFARVPNQQLQFVLLQLRVVVPCFYVIAGFLAYKGWTRAADSRAYVRKYAARIGLLYGAFCLLFLAEFVVPALISGGISPVNLLLQCKIIAVMLVINGPSVQLWFIPPLLFGVIVSYWCYERNALRPALAAALAGFAAVQAVSGSLRTIWAGTGEPFSWLSPAYGELLSQLATRYIGFGLPFVLLGVLIAKHEEAWTRRSLRPLWVAALLATALETVWLLLFAGWSDEYKLSFSLLPNTLLLFCGVLRMKGEAVRIYHRPMNLFSLVVFFGHILLMRINGLLLHWEPGGMDVFEDFSMMMLTLVECAAITSLLLLYEKKPASGMRKDAVS
ncbi:Acyltransferase family protein [Paenibacillus konkukensis]|uniref:Acyltransferase family protein n=1 Tax=Paenibacillus konkukensis TaxID=2020716 RepID=A0ABY4RVX2_9BACL|nr:acyltransferase [Paenibacillus konkukensis]UQZ85514.1 Acyltransferase family protein [Paenibacillus konkukensis]